MASITLAYGLPFASIVVGANGKVITLDNILLDTGSASTIFKTDDSEKLGIGWEMADDLRYNRGIGGVEAVIEKQVDFVQLENLRATPLTIEMGAVDYGFGINGILGMNFLSKINAVIDLKTLEVRKG